LSVQPAAGVGGSGMSGASHPASASDGVQHLPATFRRLKILENPRELGEGTAAEAKGGLVWMQCQAPAVIGEFQLPTERSYQTSLAKVSWQPAG